MKDEMSDLLAEAKAEDWEYRKKVVKAHLIELDRRTEIIHELTMMIISDRDKFCEMGVDKAFKMMEEKSQEFNYGMNEKREALSVSLARMFADIKKGLS